MKKIIIVFVIALIGLSAKTAFAATPTPTPTPSNSISQNLDLTKQIDDLKNKVASKVAQLKLVEKKGLVGTVTDVRDNQISLTDLSGNVRFVDVDEFTKFTPLKESSTFGISDITRGMKLGVLGLYNKESRRTLARFVEELELPQVISGVVASKDDKTFDLIIATGKENKKVSVESITKTFLVADDGTMTKSGFTKIEEKQNVVISGFPDPKDRETLTAGRIFVFENIPANPAIDLNVQEALPSASASIVPSTGSGVKLTPIVK